MARVDWSASEHWSPERKTCRSCGASTTCVTAEAGRARKFCVERAIDRIRVRRTCTDH